MSWTYVKHCTDETYSIRPPPALKRARKDAFPPHEFELRFMLVNWQIHAFVPFDSLSWIDKVVSRKKYRKVKSDLEQADATLRAKLSAPQYFAALQRIVSVMPDHVPQKQYLLRNFIVDDSKSL